MPLLVRLLIETTPAESILILSDPVVLKDKLSANAENPVVVLPVNLSDGNAVVPAGSCNAPVIVSPAFKTLLEALPVTFAVIVVAEKLPDASRATIVLGVLSGVASVLIVISSVLVVIVKCGLAINVLKFKVTPVLFLNTSPVPAPTFAPVVASGKVKREKNIGSVSMIANGVLLSQLEPVYIVPERISTYACPAGVPEAKSAGRVQAPALATHRPFSTGLV